MWIVPTEIGPLRPRKINVVPTATLPKKSAKKQPAGASKPSPVLWIAGALVAVVVVVIAVLALTGGDDGSTAAGGDDAQAAVNQTNDVSIVGAALPRFGEVETAAGTAVPQASGVDFSGAAVTLLEPGTPTVIGFFAHWCPHCQSEVDELSKHLAANGFPDDVNIVAVSTSVDSTQDNFPPSAWFESEGWSGPVLTDDADSSVATSYGLSGFPFWAIVDADGNLVSRTAGGIGPAQLDAFVELARAGS